MKTKTILISLCILCSSMGFAQNKLFDRYAEMDNVTSVYISKAMFRMMSNIDKVGVNMMNLKGKIESLQLLTAENKERTTQMKRDFSQLVSSNHEELMRVKDKDSNIRFYADMKGDLIKELIMLIDDNKSYTAILLTGNFTIKDIQDLMEEN